MMQSVVLKSSLRTFVLTILVLALASGATSKCTPAGFYCTSFTQFQMCLLEDSLEVIQPDIYTCPAGTTCSDNCNSANPCTPEACPVTCNVTNNQPIPGVSHSYYRCVVGPMGEVTVTVLPCAAGTSFDVASGGCRAPTTPAPSTTPSTTTTTTPKPFTCTQTGRFPHPTDCNKYYYCAARLDGSFTRTDYNCPTGSFFNINTRLCCFDARYCVTGGKNQG